MAVEVYECPSCGATVDKEATECPKCGEVFEVSGVPEVEVESKVRGKLSGGRERLLFYAGVLLVLAGGPGIAVEQGLAGEIRDRGWPGAASANSPIRKGNVAAHEELFWSTRLNEIN